MGDGEPSVADGEPSVADSGQKRRGRGPARDYGTATRLQPKRGAAEMARERLTELHHAEQAPELDDEGNKQHLKKVAKLTGTSTASASKLKAALAGYNDIDFSHLPSIQARCSPSTMDQPQKLRLFNFFDSVCGTVARAVCGNGADEAMRLWHETKSEARNAELALQRSLQQHIKGGEHIKAAVRGSVERAVLQAVAVSAVSAARFTPAARQLRHDFEMNADQSLARARQHQANLERYGKVNVGKYGKRKISDERVYANVDTALQHMNVLSWGVMWRTFVKTAEEGMRRHQLVCVTRKMPATNIVEHLGKLPPQLRLGRRVRYEIVNAISSGEDMTRNAVDYVKCELVYENRKRLLWIVERCGESDDEKERMKKGVTAAFEYLNHGFKARLGDGKCKYHSVEHAMDTAAAAGAAFCDTCCNECKNMFGIISDVKSRARQDHRGYVSDCAKKCMLYMAHCMRVKVQQEAIDDVMEELKKDPRRVHIVADFKMKILQRYYREATVLHYGKRGMSYHGAAICFSDDGESIIVRYIDVVVDGDNEQDVSMTLAVMEATIHKLKQLRGSDIRVSLQTDGAANYTGVLFHLLLKRVFDRANLTFLRYIYSETQDGKTFVDGHFGKVSYALNNYCVMARENVASSSEVANALEFISGLPGTYLLVISIDRAHLTALTDKYMSVAKVAKDVMPDGRTLEIDYVNHGYKRSSARGFELATKMTKFAREYVRTHPLQISIEYFEAMSRAKELAGHKNHDDQGDDAVMHEGDEEGNDAACVGEFDEEGDDAVMHEGDEEGNDAACVGEFDEEGAVRVLSESEAVENVPTQQEEVALTAAMEGDHDDDDDDGHDERRENDTNDDEDEGGDTVVDGDEVSAMINHGVTRVSITRQVNCEMFQRSWRRRNIKQTDMKDETTYHTLPQDVRSRALRRLASLETCFSTPSTLRVPPPSVSTPSNTADTRQQTQLERGWALRGALGSPYGAKYMNVEFRQAIIEMFRAGEAHKGSKSSPNIMIEKLVEKFPDKIVPGILEIASMISSMAQLKNTDGALDNLLYTRDSITVERVPEMAAAGERCLKRASVSILRSFLSGKGKAQDGRKPELVKRVLDVCREEEVAEEG